MKIKFQLTCAAAAVMLSLSGPALAEVTANGSVTNNYLWRGLTQSNNEAAVQGGIDWAGDNGFYIGTWVSNVEYASDDGYSYEHDIYAGFSGGDDLTYDVGYLYYNYDDSQKFDFGEIYGTLGYGGFSASLYVLANTEADEPTPDLDYGFGQAYYLSLDYGFETESGIGIGFHVGQHDGDFVDAFNGIAVNGDASYIDYSVSLSIDALTFTVSDTDLPSEGCFACGGYLDNGEMKFVVSYGMEFGL
jgi:uncharacterized protein (TIGR02001 family)